MVRAARSCAKQGCGRRCATWPGRLFPGPIDHVSAAALRSLTVAPLAPTASSTTNRSNQSVGQNLSYLRLAQMCNGGTIKLRHVSSAGRHEYYKQPYGYPHLLSLGYLRLRHRRLLWRTGLNVVISGLTASAIFCLTLLLTRARAPVGGTRGGVIHAAAGAAALVPLGRRRAVSGICLCARHAGDRCLSSVFRSTAALLWMVSGVELGGVFSTRVHLDRPSSARGPCSLSRARRDESRAVPPGRSCCGCLLLTPAVAHLAAVRKRKLGQHERPLLATVVLEEPAEGHAYFYVADLPVSGC